MWLLQGVENSAGGWIGPTMAISLAIIALSFIVIAGVIAFAGVEAMRRLRALGEAMEGLRGDLSPALQAVRGIADESRQLTKAIGAEATELVETGRQLRLRFQERLANLEAIYDVVEEEIEETALDVATALRRFRTRDGWVGRIRHLLLRSGR